MPGRYEPFAELLSDLMLGMSEVGDGTFDVPLKLTPKGRSFVL